MERLILSHSLKGYRLPWGWGVGCLEDFAMVACYKMLTNKGRATGSETRRVKTGFPVTRFLQLGPTSQSSIHPKQLQPLGLPESKYLSPQGHFLPGL